MDNNIPLAFSDNSSYRTDVPGIAKELHLQLQRYIEAQYPIRHRDVIAERHALLEEAGVISQEPFIESMPGYTSGPRYSGLALPSLLTNTLEELASPPLSLLPQHLYEHQAQALEMFLGQDRDLIVVTGTGSGKTETFLLPILLRSITEAHTHPHNFSLPGMRALLLYPMNALVNDQLKRLRILFGDGKLAKWLRQHTNTRRSIRFGMYTSRTPYPGVMSKEKNAQQLLPLLDYYLQLEADPSSQLRELKENGRWPALDLTMLRNTAISNANATVGDNDYELYTRHQIQQWCPDILITNYSMLEYMLMRPIEQTIFQQTAEWLAEDSSSTLLIVLDEAHLYSGVTGTEIALLLRRLQARLGIHRERVRYILTSASLDIGENGQHDILDFATALVGTRSQNNADFAIIEGKHPHPPTIQSKQNNSANEKTALAEFNLPAFTNRAADSEAGHQALMQLAAKLNWPPPLEAPEVDNYLGNQLPSLHVFQQLWKSTSEGSISFHALAQQLFPDMDEQKRSISTSTLLALAAAARMSDRRPLLPIRAHLFFRGLPPLYACINPQCSARRVKEDDSILGALWLSPRLHCRCGARVYELYAHRNCGTLFLRAFPSGEAAEFYWHEPSKGPEKTIETLLLLGQPHPKADEYEPINLHVMTGRVLSASNQFLIDRDHEQAFIRVYRPNTTKKVVKSKARNSKVEIDAGTAYWKSCPVCRKRLNNSITSLATKGEQPFVNLIRRQFELQPPSTSFRETTPNMGRKVLLFSDGRQRAARLARDLPREVELDTFRQALLLAVVQRSRQTGQSLVRMDQTLYNEFIGICAHYHLYFFDGESQKDLLQQIEDLHEKYELDIQEAQDDDWEPAASSGYRLALLRQIADPFYSIQRMCAAVVEPRPASLKQLKRKQLFARLTDTQLRALVIIWIEELLEESAFDAQITPHDRENTVPGSGFAYTSAAEWNDAEKAAESLLGYTHGELSLIRRTLVDELCNKEYERAFLNPEKLALRLTLDEPWHQCQDCARLIWLPLNDTCPNQRCGSSRLIQLPGDDLSLRARTDFYREPIRQAMNGTRDPRHITAEEHTAQLSYRDIQQVSTTTEEYELRFQDIGLSMQRPSIDILSCTTTMEVGIDIGSLLGIGLRTMPPRRANYQQRAGRAGRRSAILSTVLTYSENGSHDAHYFAHPEEMISGKLPCPQISPINERLTRRHIQAALIQTFFLEHISKMGTMSNRQYSYLAEALGTANTFFTTTGSASLTGFEKWLKDVIKGSNPRLMPQISAWLPTKLGRLFTDEQEKRDFVHKVANLFIEQLYEIAKQLFPLTSSEQRDVKDQAFDITNDERLLDLLFEHDFLPTYAFPREVRSFVIEKWKERNGNRYIGIEQRPQQSVDIALSEYAPGRDLIVDKATYRVGGIYVDPFPGATVANRVPSLFKHPCHMFALCMNCGYTLQLEANEPDDQEEQRCPLCNRILTIREILDPPGFAPERARKLEAGQLHNDKTTSNGGATQVKLVLPQINANNFSEKTASPQVTWSPAEHRSLLIINSGNGGDGFSVCRSCGTATSGDPSWLQKSHDRPFHVPAWVSAAKKCSAPDGIWRGYFGHLFYSDLLLLRLQWPQGVAYELGAYWMHNAFDTLAQALLLAATRLLDISTSELQAGWSYSIAAQQTSLIPTSMERVAYFYLFDTLSGGAGYATQVGLYIDRLLEETQHILDHCPEKCEQSCYRCLRTYHNRMLHHRLDRHLAGTLLHAIVSGQAPETLSLAHQREKLEMLRHYLDLSGECECRSEETIHGVEVPLLVKGAQGTQVIGVYPVQQDRRAVRHPLDTLAKNQVQLFSDYELAHDLPYIAHLLL